MISEFIEQENLTELIKKLKLNPTNDKNLNFRLKKTKPIHQYESVCILYPYTDILKYLSIQNDNLLLYHWNPKCRN